MGVEVALARGEHTGRSSRSRSFTGSVPITHVRPKSPSQPSKTGPKSAYTMSSPVIGRSGGFSWYGCSVFGPERMMRLCQWRFTPNRVRREVDHRRGRFAVEHARAQ